MLKQTIYSILIVSSSAKFNSTFTGFLPKHIFSPIKIVDSVNKAKRECLDITYDIIIINHPLREEPGFEFAADLAASTDSAILFVANEMLFSDTKTMFLDKGIVTLPTPSSPKVISQTMDNICSMRQRLKKYEHKVVSVESKMAEIRHVNQAKLLLIEKNGMSESEAHHFIEKESMNTHTNKDTIALQIIHSSIYPLND